MSDFGIIKTYVQLNEQVTLQNQDPVKIKAGLKPSLIDLEAYGESYGDKGQGRDLRIMFQGMQMPTRIKITRLFQAFLAYSNVLRRDLVGSQLIGISLPKLNHGFAVSFFNGQVWKNLFAEIQKSIASCYPRKDLSLKFTARSASANSRIGSTENFIKPIDQNFFGVINLKQSAIMFRNISIALFFWNFGYEKAPFSVDNSCHICKINFFVDSWNIILRIFL